MSGDSGQRGGSTSEQARASGGRGGRGGYRGSPQAGGRNQTAGGGGSVITDVRRPDVWYYVTLTIGLFVVVGLGYGLTFWLFTEMGDFDGTGGTLIRAFGAMFGFLLGPVVAIFSGGYVALDSPRGDDTTLAVASAVGSVVGFVVMVVVLVVFIALGAEGGDGGSGDTGDDGGDLPGGLGGTVGLLLGIAVSAAATVYLTRWLSRRR